MCDATPVMFVSFLSVCLFVFCLFVCMFVCLFACLCVCVFCLFCFIFVFVFVIVLSNDSLKKSYQGEANSCYFMDSLQHCGRQHV